MGLDKRMFDNIQPTEAIESGYLNLAHAIIKRAIRDAMPGYKKCEAQIFFSSEGFLWFLQLIGFEPEDLENIADRIAQQAFGP